MNLTHRGSASAKVIERCLVLVKTYGNNPRKLLNTIKVNNEMNTNVLPFTELLPIRVLNSRCRVTIILFHRKENRDGINQNDAGININPRVVLSQLKEVLNDVEGSNDENRLVIIFSLVGGLIFLLT